MDTIEQLLQRGQQTQNSGEVQALLSAPEAEKIIEQLAPLAIEEVGGRKWHMQHEWIERLNLQAHYNAQTHSDEFVVELLVSLDKLHVIVHDLLLIEAWKEFVYPLLASHLAERVDSLTSYVLLYHEITVASLLQVVLYHPHAVESLSEDYALEVADWCYRKLTRLNTDGQQLAQTKEITAEERLSMSRMEELEEKRREIEFGVMMCSLAILRYITDGLPRMPMGALSRVVSTNDTLMGLLPLLDRPPWVRTRVPTTGGLGGGARRPVLEKWVGNGWVVVPPADRLKITQTDGQVWLAVTNLLVEPRCRAKYGMDDFRRERILGLKRHLNELMFDQLPVLKDLQRVLDELALGVLPDQSGAGKTAALILEAVPVVRAAMLRGRNWRAVADQAKKEQFGQEAARMARERLEAMVKNLDFLCELQPKPQGAAAEAGADAAATATAAPPPVKISTWRKVHDSGVYEPWYDFVMDVDDTKPPEPVEVAAANAGVAPSSKGTKGASGDAAAVHGLRYRLRALDFETTRPLPAHGKAVVRWGDLTAEALIQLPELPTRSSEEGAAALWVTVGLLAVDGVVLQVKLKKSPKPKERDRVAGVWYAYHPVAGALTVLRDPTATVAASSAATNPQDVNERVTSASTASGAKMGVSGTKPGGGSRRPLVQVISEPGAAAGAKAVPQPRAVVASADAPLTSVSSPTGKRDGNGGASSGSAGSSSSVSSAAAATNSVSGGENSACASVTSSVTAASSDTPKERTVEALRTAMVPPVPVVNTIEPPRINVSARCETVGSLKSDMAVEAVSETGKPIEAVVNKAALSAHTILSASSHAENQVPDEEYVGLDDPE